MERKRLVVEVVPELYLLLRIEAATRDTTLAAIVREALMQYLNVSDGNKEVENGPIPA